MIELKPINWDNLDECIDLQVKEEQKNFVASNLFSLAQAYVALLNDDFPPITHAIYNDEKVIGFVMISHDTAEENNFGNEECYCICRFMIDKKFQGKGYGRQAFAKTLEFIKTYPQGQVPAVYLSYEPENIVAKNLYASFGFVETGDIIDNELVARLQL